MRRTNLSGHDVTDKARVFFALWPSPQSAAEIRKIADAMRLDCAGRAMRVETLHLTLLFLGDVPRQKLPQLIEAGGNLHASQFELLLDQVACWRHNRLLYLAPSQVSLELLQLVNSLRVEVLAAGFRYEAREFVAHVTLLRDIADVIPRRQVSPLVWQVREFVLVESVLQGDGRRCYQQLASWPLV